MLQPGDVIEGKYRIARVLGQGGMGAVYEGDNFRIHRRVAVKVLHATVAAKDDVVQRFEREAQAAGRIGSQHIVEVLDLGNLPSGERYMVMEFLDGESLGDRIKRRKRLEVHEVGPIIYQLLEGLGAAHQAGIIHRDLKPDNVYLCQRGAERDFVKILDFGVSKFSTLDLDSLSMTKSGAVMGTPYYMSPEQARGSKIDERSDLYSVGVVMYQAVTGRVPFSAETFNELVFKIALESPDPPERLVPELERGFAAIIARAMVRDVGLRFQSAQEFQAAIGHWWQSATGVHLAQPMSGVHARPSHPSLAAAPPSRGPADVDGPDAALGASPARGMTVPQGAATSGASPPDGHAQRPPSPGHQQLGQSQAGLTLTARPLRRSRAMIALGLLGTVVAVVAALGAYKALTVSSVVPDPPSAGAATAAVDTAAPAAGASQAVAIEAPSAEAPEPKASAAPTAETSSTAVKSVKPGPVVKKGAPTATPTAAPDATPTSTGRVIDGEL